MTDVQVVNLPIAMFVSGQYVMAADGIEDVSDRHLALKSEETPIELLRRIPGFQDADPVPLEYAGGRPRVRGQLVSVRLREAGG